MSKDDGASLGNDTSSMVEQESLFGRMPLKLSEREYGPWGANGTCFAYAIATWCFLTGGYAAELVGAVQGMVCLIAGNLIGTFLVTMPLSLGCQRYGLEQIDFCKPTFGQRGAHILLIFYLINMIGWSGLILVMFGNGIRNLAEAFGYTPGDWIVSVGVALGIGLSYTVATRGVHLFSVFNSIITPALGLLVAFMFYMLLDTHGWEAIAAAEPLNPTPDPLLNYAIVVELGIASGISWWGGIGFLARNTRTRRSSIYPEIIQLGFATGVVCAVALFSGLVVQSDDPTEWMVPIGGVFMGVIALIFIALANVTSTAVSLYASGLALRHVPALRERPWWQLILVTILPCVAFVFWPHQLYDLGDAFLAYNGTMYAPIGGIVFADYVFLRGQRLNLRAIFEDHPDGEYHYWRGFNALALGSIVLGQAVYLSLYNPLTAEAHWLFHFVPASIAACLVPAVVYGIGARLLGVHERAAAKLDARGRPARLTVPNI
jgi:NCS1 family nucleobase:cation symporter-1